MSVSSTRENVTLPYRDNVTFLMRGTLLFRHDGRGERGQGNEGVRPSASRTGVISSATSVECSVPEAIARGVTFSLNDDITSLLPRFFALLPAQT